MKTQTESSEKITHIREAELTPYLRVYIKKNNIIVRTMHSASGHDYRVTIFEGRARFCQRTNGEDCPSWHYRQHCHHAQLAEQLERERDERRSQDNNFALAMGF